VAKLDIEHLLEKQRRDPKILINWFFRPFPYLIALTAVSILMSLTIWNLPKGAALETCYVCLLAGAVIGFLFMNAQISFRQSFWAAVLVSLDFGLLFCMALLFIRTVVRELQG